MDSHAEMIGETSISLEQMLVAREQRVARQAVALARFGRPLISVTVVIPGPIKDGQLPRHLMTQALRELDDVAFRRGWSVLSHEVLWQETGPEALYVIDTDTWTLKSAAIELEDRHPIGRLWDLDVIAPGTGSLSRRSLGFPPRPCLVCPQPAHVCGRSRRHPLEELLSTLRKIVHEYDLRTAI
ncbi:citrate lyase holo-[acyl-carrier protein] synthase [Mesorhizobium sp. Cs1299R1N1]|uniref:citrate lyase holo-[acyl-carrier protein] synthase n=1 Tax=Mesorhizobium sp. Cs1299R1N1 TaxID=3015172 RepID=UPI00301CF3DE